MIATFATFATFAAFAPLRAIQQHVDAAVGTAADFIVPTDYAAPPPPGGGWLGWAALFVLPFLAAAVEAARSRRG